MLDLQGTLPDPPRESSEDEAPGPYSSLVDAEAAEPVLQLHGCSVTAGARFAGGGHRRPDQLGIEGAVSGNSAVLVGPPHRGIVLMLFATAPPQV